MFKKSSSAVLRAAALKSEAKAQRELAKAQTDQVKAVRQLELADQIEKEEMLEKLKKESHAVGIMWAQAASACTVAANELEKAQAFLDAAKRNVAYAEEVRQATTVEYDKTRTRVKNMKETLKKVETND